MHGALTCIISHIHVIYNGWTIPGYCIFHKKVDKGVLLPGIDVATGGKVIQGDVPEVIMKYLNEILILFCLHNSNQIIIFA